MTKNVILKIAGVVIPLVVAVTGILYGDVTPVIRDLCEAALPAGAFGHQVDATGDAGAAR